MSVCSNCGREKILAEQAVVGYPDHHIAGSTVEYCGFCDVPPELTLDIGKKGFILEPNKPLVSDHQGGTASADPVSQCPGGHTT